MRRTYATPALIGSFAVFAALTLGCTAEERQPTTTFYDRSIAPVLLGSCDKGPSGSKCHVTADDRGNALGNLDVTSFELLTLRRDLLIEYGPYGMPNLLLKNVGDIQLRLSTWDTADPIIITTDIPHAGGSRVRPNSTAFTTLKRWIDNGATENNAPPPPDEIERRPCSDSIGSDPLFDPSADPPDPDFQQFIDDVNPVLTSTCNAGNCHGSPVNQLYLTCGKSPEQKRWNYFIASDYVSVDVSTSEILRRTLDPSQGGVFHEGGVIYATKEAGDYRKLEGWANARGGPRNQPTDPGFQFFAKRVQPMLVKKGCMILGCHSPAMFHDYRLRGGSGGHFGLPATRTNYELTLEQLALESADPNASRLIRKNLPITTSFGGIRHRGGALLAAGGDPSVCDFDAAENGPLDDQSPYCVIVRWFQIEREERMVAPGAVPLSAVLYVRRPPRSGRATPQDWAQYDPGADLVRADASVDPMDGTVTAGGNETSLLGSCGLDPATTDVRRPAVSWDGMRVAFAARTSANEPWRIYTAAPDGAGCAVEPTIDAPAVDEDGNPVPDNGELVHDFDPAFAPDGRIVFASTRGNTKNVGVFSYQGPQRTPADPAKLNANLYVLENGAVRQLTFLLNQEVLPSFMSDGRVIFTAEKRAPGFYQLAGRRQNLDGGDYHPLFGQRDTIGFDQFTDVVELSDKNLAAIFSRRGAAHGAGTLAIVNRSIGVDQRSTDPADYLVAPSAISYPNPDFYQPSIHIVDGAATGTLDGTNGAYRNPSPLPNGQLLVSYAANVTDLANVSGNFDVVIVDPITGQRTPVAAGPEDEVWPVAVYARPNRGVFQSRFDEPNGHTQVFNDDRRDRSEITFVDAPLLASLLFQNTRDGRRLPDMSELEFFASLPPEPGVTDFASGGSFVTDDQHGQLYVRRQRLGAASLRDDGSARVTVPGGVPFVLAAEVQLDGDAEPTLHHQREEMQFYPGEFARQSFKRELFNGLCAGCHGSVEGLENHIAVRPDILTKASIIDAAESGGDDLRDSSGEIVGPPFP